MCIKSAGDCTMHPQIWCSLSPPYSENSALGYRYLEIPPVKICYTCIGQLFVTYLLQ